MNVTRRSRRRQALEPARHPGAGQRGSGGRQRLGKIIGDASRSVGVEHYGASADYQTLYRQFGITAAAVAAAARYSIHDAQNGARPGARPATFAPAAGGTADRPGGSSLPCVRADGTGQYLSLGRGDGSHRADTGVWRGLSFSGAG